MSYKIKGGKLFPRGKVVGHDEGQIGMQIFAHPATGVVVIQFPSPVRWMALEADKVDEMIRLLQKHRNSLN